MGRVLNDPELVLSGKTLKGIEIHQNATNMDRHDTDYFAFRSLESVPSVVEIHVKSHWIAIDQDRSRTLITHYFGGRREGHRRDQNALPLFQAERFDGQMKRSRPRIQSDRMQFFGSSGLLLLFITD